MELSAFHWQIVISGSILFSSWILMWIWGKCTKMTVLRKHSWLRALVQSISLPVYLTLFFGGGLAVAYYFLGEQTVPRSVFHILGILAVVWIVINFVQRGEAMILRKQRFSLNQMNVHLAVRLLRAAVVFGGLLLILPLLNISVTGILAFGGIGAIIVGMAAQNMLSNLFGGIILILDRPFREGDLVSCPDKKIEGHVEHVGWRMTRLRSLDKQPIYVPNSTFSTIVLQNQTCMTHRMIKKHVYLRYEHFPLVEPILEEMRAYICSHPDIDQRQHCSINVESYSLYGIQILIHVFTEKTLLFDYMAVQEEVFLHMGKVIRKHGAEFVLLNADRG